MEAFSEDLKKENEHRDSRKAKRLASASQNMQTRRPATAPFYHLSVKVKNKGSRGDLADLGPPEPIAQQAGKFPQTRNPPPVSKQPLQTALRRKLNKRTNQHRYRVRGGSDLPRGAPTATDRAPVAQCGGTGQGGPQPRRDPHAWRGRRCSPGGEGEGKPGCGGSYGRWKQAGWQRKGWIGGGWGGEILKPEGEVATRGEGEGLPSERGVQRGRGRRRGGFAAGRRLRAGRQPAAGRGSGGSRGRLRCTHRRVVGEGTLRLVDPVP